MPLLEELGYIPPEKYVTGHEIKKHFDLIARTYGLKCKTLFQTEVRGMMWDEKSKLWEVRTNYNDNFKAKYTITATGNLHSPKLPGISGISAFAGRSFHSTRWDYKYTGGEKDGVLSGLEDKRVAVIGTGATSIQVIPAVAKYAKHLYAFQRTAAAVSARNNKPTVAAFASSLTPGWQRRRQENFNAVLIGVPVHEDLVNDGWTAGSMFSVLGSADEEITPQERIQFADMLKMQRIRARVDEVVRDTATAERLKPWYGSICKRPCFSDEYLETFNRPNCTLVDTDGKGVDEITENGVAANGVEYEVDLIIYCTGFDLPATAWKHTDIDITGRDGTTLKDTWLNNGVSTLYGSQSHNFPNYFNVSVLQAGVSPNFVYTLETHAKHIVYVISECEKLGVKSVEPSAEAEQAWTVGIIEGSKIMRYAFLNCTPSYFNNEGNMSEAIESQGIYAAGASAWAKVLEEWREEGLLNGLECES
jgi:cation diffusion facilitator CzcD-associated flavoprotein CzcO